MTDRPEFWLEAAAGVQAHVDEQVRSEAFEVFQAEAARCRLGDRMGRLRVALRCGSVVTGDAGGFGGAPPPAGTLLVRKVDGRALLISVSAVTEVTGSSAGRRREGGLQPSLASMLRECWSAQTSVLVLRHDARWTVGRVAFVGADHVELRLANEALTIPFSAVEAWDLGEPLMPYSGTATWSSAPNGWAWTNSRVCLYFRAMNSSSAEASTRHWPRPPILMAGRSPLRTSA
jgi:hypothetical protein